jgi:phosphopantothenoylcysteine decarboxylase/phosphopantothenate--cysteine ligase
MKGKKILLGICGSIAAYKSAFLVRLLIKSGAEVKVIMTNDAKTFVSPLTFSTLSKNPVYSQLSDVQSGEWTNHVELAKWCDVLLIAPASANTIAKMANGLCDNLLMATYLSSSSPVFVSPAMDLDMYKHPSTLHNLGKINLFGNTIIPATYGELASGLVGEGRMAEPEEIVKQLSDFFLEKHLLKGKTILISAGPTYEAIDPVRFIGNHSSGKMGFCIAEAAANYGAKVILVSGPTTLKANHAAIKQIDITSAEEMYNICTNHFEKADIAIMSAAVSDFTPKVKFDKKLKKGIDKVGQIELVPTKDILKELGNKKAASQILVGFALETDNELANARKKLESKNLDMLVLNSLNDAGAGFKYDTNKVSIIDKYNNVINYELKPKTEVAKNIFEHILRLLKK